MTVTAFGIAYVNWLLGYAFWLRDLEAGKEWVLLLVLVTWLGETAAYLVGSVLGRHALAPLVSPKKTVEGAAAQLVVSVVAALIARAWFFPALPLSGAVLVGLMLGVVGQVGDLVESALKRSVGVKDTGRLIPGHGGMLDRIDSLLFNTPVLFYYAVHVRGAS
jgi:phosphatidate cytidylyltransferase